ncbi:hypothetical protein OIU77_030490 [Salix suchowensis]|uniref:Uncharacterized protein n=1 Tax=Salix suchowensis TaxID=1278906 RepID=A0ABQ9BE59_9ROSI|nr:hypothetical protein OIU77_030490 [Salix suchowensis]
MEKLHYTWQQRMVAVKLHGCFLLMVLLLKPKRMSALLVLCYPFFFGLWELWKTISNFNCFFPPCLILAEWNDTITPGSLVLNQWKIAQLLRHCWSIMLTAVQRTMYCRCSIFSILIHFSLL